MFVTWLYTQKLLTLPAAQGEDTRREDGTGLSAEPVHTMLYLQAIKDGLLRESGLAKQVPLGAFFPADDPNGSNEDGRFKLSHHERIKMSMSGDYYSDSSEEDVATSLEPTEEAEEDHDMGELANNDGSKDSSLKGDRLKDNSSKCDRSNDDISKEDSSAGDSSTDDSLEDNSSGVNASLDYASVTDDDPDFSSRRK